MTARIRFGSENGQYASVFDPIETPKERRSSRRSCARSSHERGIASAALSIEWTDPRSSGTVLRADERLKIDRWRLIEKRPLEIALRSLQPRAKPEGTEVTLVTHGLSRRVRARR